MTEQVLTDLSAHIGTGWTPTVPCGYYIHRGRVYLQGEVQSTRDGTTSPDFLVTLPAAIWPATPQTMTIVSDFSQVLETPDLRSRAIPLEYSVTVSTDGRVSVDSLPTYVNADPPDTYAAYSGPSLPLWTETPDYDPPLYLVLVLGQITWPLASATTDTWTGISLASYLSSDFTDIDSQVAIHDARVHLSGHVQAARDGAGDGSIGGDSGFLFSRLPIGYAPTELGGAAYDPATDSDYTAGSSSRGLFPIYLAYEGTDLTSGSLVTDIGPTTGAPAWTPPSTSSPELFSSWLGVSGLLGHQYLRHHNMGDKAPFDAGLFGGKYNSGVMAGTATNDGTVGFLPWTLSHDFNLNTDLFAHFLPWPPDWVAVYAFLGASADEVDVAGSITADDVSFQILDLATGASISPTSTGSAWSWGGWLSPVTPEYTGDPVNTFSQTLWRPSELAATTISLASGIDMSSSLSWGFNATWRWQLDAILFWERRRRYLRAGDVLDLTGAGWQAPFSPPPPVAHISLGDPLAGLIRLGS